MTLQELIEQYLYDHRISMREFARRCGFSNAYVSTLVAGVHPKTKKPLHPTMDTLRKVAAGMGMPLVDLLRKIGEPSGLIATTDDGYNPFFDEDNAAYGTDDEWRKLHGKIDDRPKLRELVELIIDQPDSMIDKLITIVKTIMPV